MLLVGQTDAHGVDGGQRKQAPPIIGPNGDLASTRQGVRPVDAGIGTTTDGRAAAKRAERTRVLLAGPAAANDADAPRTNRRAPGAVRWFT